MYLIVVKFTTKPEWTERWLELVDGFTQATRAEAGNLWFEWNRSVDEPDTFTLVEAFADDGAGPHVNSDHFAQAMRDLRPAPRSPVVAVQIVALPVGWTLTGTNGRPEIGLPVLVLAVAVLALLFGTAGARDALARDL